MKTYYKIGLFLGFLYLTAVLHTNAQGINQLWGVTTSAGNDGLGTIFNTATDGTKPLAQFDFSVPRKAVSMGQFTEYNGEFYGTALEVNVDNAVFKGILFKWNPATDEYTVLHNFKRETGNNPGSTMVIINNKLYGTTTEGGINEQGVIFEYDLTNNVYSKRSDFANLAKDRLLWGTSRIIGFNGKLYGVAITDNGNLSDALYEWDPETSLFSKVKNVNGSLQPGPHVPVAQFEPFEGKFYGITQSAGTNYGDLVEWDPAAGSFTSKATFTPVTGYNCLTKMTSKDGKLYGATTSGGASGAGTLFEWEPATNAITKKVDFPNAGTAPFNAFAPLLVGDKFYGITKGGEARTGLLYEWDPVTNGFSIRSAMPGNGTGIFQGKFTPWQGKLYSSVQVADPSNGSISIEVFNWDMATNVTSEYISNVAMGRAAMGSLTFADGKLYGMTSEGGKDALGVIFEFDPQKKAYKIMQELSKETGSKPLGKMVLRNGKLYGMTSAGGVNGLGTLFELDYKTNVFTKKLDFESINGSRPYANLVERDGKFFGMTPTGGVSNRGVIFEWDPETNIYTKRYDFDLLAGASPFGNLCWKDGKFYGMTMGGGAFNTGTVFQWDPATNVYTKLRDLRASTGLKPYGSLTVYGDKLYGLTQSTLLEVDPATQDVSVLVVLGNDLKADITVNNNKLYFMGTYEGGSVFEWDPATKILKTKARLSTDSGINPFYMTPTPVPAPVSAGNPGTCMTLANSLIGTDNFNEWLAVTDASNEAVAEIKANGNNLGTIKSWLYTHSGAVRKRDGRYFLGRDFTMTPSGSITSGQVDVRIYIKQEEYDALVAANNADMEVEPIQDVTQIGVFTTGANSCSGSISGSPRAIATSVEPWTGGGYVFSFKTDAFSTFYLANTNRPLPVKLINFNAQLLENDAVLNWQTAEEVNFSHFELQRSEDGRSYQAIATIEPSAGSIPGHYNFIDTQLGKILVPKVYYRLKMTDWDGTFAYSTIRELAIPNAVATLYPNPVADIVEVKLPKVACNWQLINSAGMQMLSGQSEGGNFKLNVSKLHTGVYFLRFTTARGVRTLTMAKK
ncbi:choice-of-anchor tandem repeat GloVer-containing protein [Dyadobacter sp. BHUBP1]|uniref:choice-of-anchor tandem repeat GloVer-containing protein n=1 Tax=Dyadobacter sp. BHUBP1 TaxID=3424178 RepID=UPI003D32F2FF